MSTPDQVALVTGASRGIGRAIALALAGEGYRCVINYARNAAAADEVRGRIEAGGGEAMCIQADIASAADRRRLVDETVRACGRIDLLVNNAGAGPDVRADLLEATEESFDRMIDINLKGPYFLSQLVANRMIEQTRTPDPSRRSPKIVTVTSISVYTASTNRGDYCLAKSALAMMTRLYAVRLAEHGIGVFEIRPGIIETDMTGPVKEKYDRLILEEGLTPIRRWGQPDDVARAVVAVARDHFPFSTGEVINVDGGFHLRQL